MASLLGHSCLAALCSLVFFTGGSLGPTTFFFNETQKRVSVGVVILSGGLSQLQDCSPTKMVPL